MPDTPQPRTAIVHDKYERLIKRAQANATIKVAVAHPCDDVSLQGSIEAARLRLIEPILVGPEQRIRRVAQSAGLDIGGMEIVNAEHSHDFRGEGGRTGDGRARRSTDEGQPPYR